MTIGYRMAGQVYLLLLVSGIKHHDQKQLIGERFHLPFSFHGEFVMVREVWQQGTRQGS